MNLTDLFPAFDAYLREKYPSRTRYGYNSRLRRFLCALDPTAKLVYHTSSKTEFVTVLTTEDLTRASIAGYLKKRADSTRPRSVQSELGAIRVFCYWLVSQGHLPVSPTINIKPPAPDAPRREVPTNEAVAALIAGTDRMYPPYRAVLAKAVIATLVHTGLRRSELMALDLADLDLADKSITVRHGKFDKARIVFPHDDCLAAIKAYLEFRTTLTSERRVAQFREHGMGRPQALFLNKNGGRIRDETLRDLLRQAYAVAGMAGSKALLPHSLRHAYATRLLRNGADIVDIAATLGHSNIATTSLYLHSGTARLKSIAHLSSVAPETPTPHPSPEPAPAAVPKPKRLSTRNGQRNGSPREERAPVLTPAAVVPPPPAPAPPVALTLAEKRRAAWANARK